MELAWDSKITDRLRRDPPRFEQTYETPMQDLPRFVKTILSCFQVDSAQVSIELLVFEPHEVIDLLVTKGLEKEAIEESRLQDAKITATNSREAAALLEACLAEWLDFTFESSPGNLMLYADHDEWTTLFANEATDLEMAIRAMNAAGFEMITDWRRFAPPISEAAGV